MDHITSRKASRRNPEPVLGPDLDYNLAFWLPFRPSGHVVFVLFPPGFCHHVYLFQIRLTSHTCQLGLFLITSRALIYSNYFGFAILSCVALDYDSRSGKDFGKSLRFFLASGGILLVAYG